MAVPQLQIVILVQGPVLAGVRRAEARRRGAVQPLLAVFCPPFPPLSAQVAHDSVSSTKMRYDGSVYRGKVLRNRWLPAAPANSMQLDGCRRAGANGVCAALALVAALKNNSTTVYVVEHAGSCVLRRAHVNGVNVITQRWKCVSQSARITPYQKR